jgi:hypothetical protein
MGGTVRDSSRRASSRGGRAGFFGLLAVLIRIVGWLFVVILVAHIALTLGEANPANSITTFVAYWAERLQLGFQNLFTPADTDTRILLNFGLAALFWLVVSSVLARLVRRLG